MASRLSAADLSLLALETPQTPMHNATLEILEPGESGFDYDRLRALVEDRLAFVPRYRKRLRTVPGGLGTPVWVEDETFDLSYHVRRSALPSPGDDDQLRDLVGRIMSRRLDASRPLWEVYVIEGLQRGRVAMFTKSHQLLVDGSDTVDLAQVLLDSTPDRREMVAEDWVPRSEPRAPGLLIGAVRDNLARPEQAVEAVRASADAVGRRAARRLGPVARLARAVAPGGDTSTESILSVRPSEQRRLATLATDLEDYRRIREVHGGTVNDVILATVTGGIRAWLMTRGESLAAHAHLHAMVPMSVQDDDLAPTSLGAQVAGHELKLPIGESSAVVRLHQVSYALTAHKETGKSVAANRLAGIAGFAPTTFHALGTRVALDHRRREIDLVITNVPGPQFPLYAAGSQMLSTYPVPPLQPRSALAIGVTSYDGHVFYGLTADRDAIPDVDVLAACIAEALEELVDSASDLGARAPRGLSRRRPRRTDDEPS
ncbi:wax ester/triacylglycerol synthase family O-acyltransferase [Nocardioidaceae bacterium]|nr:wax ester/triacylglycerol synthase family O-acyltransferase [Nocardioidaceae bacterium]